MAVADVEQRRVDALLGDRLAMHERHSERVAVERERGVDVVDGDADVIDLRSSIARRQDTETSD